jgi:hypothetical protein
MNSKHHLLVATLFVATLAAASAPQWIAFDQKWPHDFIDAASITSPAANIVRFWERAGARPLAGSKAAYPQYALTEINCKQRTSRDIRWDVALEDHTVAGMEARAEFLTVLAEILAETPGARGPSVWESIEPNEHSYARRDFVCQLLEKAK